GARGSAGGREVWAVPGSLTANVLDGEAGGRGTPSVSLDLSLRGLEQRDRRVLLHCRSSVPKSRGVSSRSTGREGRPSRRFLPGESSRGGEDVYATRTREEARSASPCRM